MNIVRHTRIKSKKQHNYQTDLRDMEEELKTTDWVFVINNPDSKSMEKIHSINSEISYLVYQLELSESGTEHIQGYIEFDEGKSWSELIRHSGRAGVKGKIKLKISSLSQIDIVKKTQQYFEKNGVVPALNEIDKDVREIPRSVKFNLMIYNYSELDDVAKSIRGFFTPEAANEFEKVIGIRD